MSSSGSLKFARTPSLEIAYEERGNGTPVILLHGFPYDVRAYDDVAASLAATGCRAIVPYLRGYGPTRFLDDSTMRSGEQAALGNDLRELMNALDLPRAVLAGYDWGGRAACIVAALWPERVAGLVTMNSAYNIFDTAAFATPAAPETEHRYWYQYYFHTERGLAGLSANREALCRFIWRLWSPTWPFDEATFARTAESFNNPDFVEVVIHSYRHRFGYVPGDPSLLAMESALALRPAIPVPTILLHGEADGVDPVEGSTNAASHYTGPFRRDVVPAAGHNLPQEAPAAVAAAVLELLRE